MVHRLRSPATVRTKLLLTLLLEVWVLREYRILYDVLQAELWVCDSTRRTRKDKLVYLFGGHDPDMDLRSRKLVLPVGAT